MKMTRICTHPACYYPMHFYALLLSVVLLVASASYLPADAGASGYSRNAPAVYAEQIRPLMTDIQSLLPLAGQFDSKASDAVALLNERINWIGADGRHYLLMQIAYVVVSDAAIDLASEDVFVFRPDEGEKIYLLDAMTVRPDGTVAPVGEGGVFVQTPQREARNRIYSGRKELKVIYPDVKTGAVTYVCVLIEGRGRIPGEVTLSFAWGGGWKRHLQRYVLELPTSMAQRLSVATKGELPQARIEELPQGRSRLLWEQRDMEPIHYEELGGSMHDVGPYLKASTLSDWDAFAAWYAKLLEGSSELSAELRAEVEAWTAQAQSREEIIRILFEKVANDVRYTSMNFGNAGVIPKNCNAVWQNKYGDCKDKANLLRSLLALKGIKAHVVLVNTDHLGLVEKRSPDYYSFTHAIVAIDDENGGYLFCDPTLSFAAPRVLSPGSSDRDVLVIDGAGPRGIWGRTPASSAGHIGADFDLVMEADGSARGWLTYTAEGFYGSAYMDSYRTTSRHRKESDVKWLLQSFYRNAELIDFEHTLLEDWSGDFALKVYFLIPGAAARDFAQRTVPVPDINWLLPNVGKERSIRKDAFVRAETMKVAVTVALPEQWSASGLPQPVHLTAPGLTVAGAYASQAGNRVVAQLELQTVQTRFTPREFTSLYNAMQSLGAWLSQPVVLHPRNEAVALADVAADSTAGTVAPAVASDGAVAPAGAAAPAAGSAPIRIGTPDFPAMLTARGQLELALKRFPSGRDPVKARQALEAVVLAFPEDDSVVFDAKMRLAILDWEYSNEDAALTLLDELIRTYGQTLEKESIGWAYYIKGRSLADIGRTEEALAVFAMLAEDPELSRFRRSWAESYRGRILSQSNPQEAISAFERAFALDNSEQREHFAMLAQALLENARAEQLLAMLRAQLAENPEQARVWLSVLLEWVPWWQKQGRYDLLASLAAVMEELEVAQMLGATHAEVFAVLGSAAASSAVKEELAAYIAATPPVFWESTAPAQTLVTREDFIAAIADFQKKSEPENALRHCMEMLVRFEPDAQFFYYLWRALVYAEWRERRTEGALGETIYADLLAMSAKNPARDDVYIDSLFFSAYYHRNRGDYAKELEVYRSIEQMEIETDWMLSLYRQMALAAEAIGDYDTALQAYAKLLPLQVQGRLDAAELQLRALFIHLNRADEEAALGLIRALGQIEPAQMDALEHAGQIREWSEFPDPGALLPVYWERGRAWWPKWQQFAAGIGLEEPDKTAFFIPDTEMIVPIYAALNEAEKRNDAAAYAQALRKLVDLARWYPERMSEILSINNDIIDMFPDQAQAWRELYLDMYASLEGMPDGKWVRQTRFWQLFNLYNLERFEEAYAGLIDFLSVDQERDGIVYSLNRLYAMLAIELKRDLDIVAGRLEADLQEDELTTRGISVAWLANIHGARNDKQAEYDLLVRELAHPKVIADTANFTRLKHRYDFISQSEMADANLRALSAEWLAAHGPAWLQFAKPHTLDDPRLRNLSRVLNDPERHFTEAERARLHFLAIESDELDVAAKRDQLTRAVSILNFYTPSGRQWSDAAYTLSLDERVDKSDAAFLAIMSAYVGFQIKDRERVERIYTGKDSYGLAPHQLTYLEALYDAVSTTDFRYPESVYALGERLIEKEKINLFEAEILNRSILALADMGDIERAQALYEATARASFGNDVVGGKLKMRIQWLRYVRASRELSPVYNAFRDEALALFAAADAATASAAAGIADTTAATGAIATADAIRWDSEALDRLGILPLEQRWQVLERMLEQNDFDRTGISFLDDVVSVYCDRYPLRTIDVVKLYAAALDVAPDDTTRALLLLSLIYTVDYDDAEVRAAAAPLLARWRNDATNPTTRDLITAEDIHLALRMGQTIDWQAPAVAAIRHPFNPLLPTDMVLTYHFVRGDLPQLKAELEKLDEKTMTADRILYTVMVCLEAAQMTDELELIRDTVQGKVYTLVLEAWSEDQLGAAKRAIRLAKFLKQPDLIPAQFREYLAATANEEERFVLLAELAGLDGDWQALEQASRRVLEFSPTRYEFHWYLAQALCEQGKLAEAAPLLRTFMPYSGDSLNRPQASKWLDRITAADIE